MDSALHHPTLGRPSIDLRSTRDAGGVINAAFALLRENWRGLLRAIVFLVGPVYLVVLVVEAIVATMDLYVFSGLAGLAEQMILLTMMQVIVVGYILLYNEHGRDGVTLDDLRRLLVSDIGTVFSVVALATIVSMLAGMLMLIPGIYLLVATSLSAPVRMAEESTVTSAIGRSMELVRGHWWQTFGILLIGLLVATLLSMVVELPTFFLTLAAGETLASGEGSPITRLVVQIASAVTTVLSALIVDTTLAVHYFNLVERAEGPGMLARIEQIGAASDSPLELHT